MSLKGRHGPWSNCGHVLALNVGGHFYSTTRATLGRYRDSWLAEPFRLLKDELGRFFIDRDGKIFRHVLNFLRLGELVLPEGFKELGLLEKEAEFYQIHELINAVRIMMGKPTIAKPERAAYNVGHDPLSQPKVFNIKSTCVTIAAKSKSCGPVLNHL
ncbi:BTB/POZ domain-containing protein KCTD6-like [Branchiostoma floridae x Branchiostoma japonicum]